MGYSFIGTPKAMDDFSGRFSFSHCLYMIPKGAVGSRPFSDVVDMLLIGCVLFCLDTVDQSSV